MTLDHRFNTLKDVRAALSVVLYPIHYVVNFPVTAGAWLSESFSTRETLLAHITTLETQQIIINTRLQKLAALELENIRLRALLDSSFKISEKVLIGELMAINLEPFSREIVINRGTRHGVYDGQPILDAQGIMGQITRANPLTSHAMLITDPNHAIPIAVNRSGLYAILYGTGSDEVLDLPHLPTNADIAVGDLLVSSGLGGRFPKGYPVAIITKIEYDPALPFTKVSAKPTARLKRSREVLMVWPNRPNEDIPEENLELETDAETSADEVTS